MKYFRIALAAIAMLTAAAFQEPEGNASCGREPAAHPCACARSMRCPMHGAPPIEPGDGTIAGEARCQTYCKPERCFCCKENCSPPAATHAPE